MFACSHFSPQKTTSELMAAIQLGIGQSVGRLAPKARRDVLYEDFHIVETIFYPRFVVSLYCIELEVVAYVSQYFCGTILSDSYCSSRQCCHAAFGQLVNFHGLHC